MTVTAIVAIITAASALIGAITALVKVVQHTNNHPPNP